MQRVSARPVPDDADCDAAGGVGVIASECAEARHDATHSATTA